MMFTYLVSTLMFVKHKKYRLIVCKQTSNQRKHKQNQPASNYDVNMASNNTLSENISREYTTTNRSPPKTINVKQETMKVNCLIL